MCGPARAISPAFIACPPIFPQLPRHPARICGNKSILIWALCLVRWRSVVASSRGARCFRTEGRVRVHAAEVVGTTMAHEFALKVLADVMLVGVALLFLWRGFSNVVVGWRNTKKKLGKQD